MKSEPYYKSKFISAWDDLICHTTATNPKAEGFPRGQAKTLIFSQSNGFVGSTNPFWKSQVLNVQSATTTASGQFRTYKQAFLSSELSYSDRLNKRELFVEWYGHVPLPLGSVSAPSAFTKTQADNRAKARFLQSLDDVLSSVELGQDLGEYKETVHGCTKPLHSLRNHVLSYFDSVTKLKRSFKQGNPGLLKAVADTYLEWTFGWKPLASDVADAFVGLQNRSRHFNTQPIQAKGKEFYGGGSITNIHSADGLSLSDLRSNTKTQLSYTVRYKGMVKQVLTSGSLPISQVLQIDLPHFIPTAWDLIPYSFIVDYFTNAGDVIRSYSARTNLVAWCVRTIREVHDHEIYTYTTNQAQKIATLVCLSRKDDAVNSKVSDITWSRSAIDPTVSLRPALAFQLPNSDKPWLNIAALLLGRTKALVPLIRV